MAGRYTTALRGYLNRQTPGYMIFFVTPFCNCRCKMCFNMDAILNAGKRNVLSLDEIEKFARNFPGLHHINYSGGEPLLRPDFPEVSEAFYRHAGTRFFTCPTNSSFPEKSAAQVEAMCRKCPDAWIRITQSLDGVGAVHDEIRGRQGLFEEVVEMNARLAELQQRYKNLSVGISMVMCTYNRGHEYDVLDYVYDNLSFTDFGALYVRGETYDDDAKEIDADEYAKFQEACRKKNLAHHPVRGFAGRAFAAIKMTSASLLTEVVQEDRYVTPCTAGKRMVVMDDQGRIEPCEMLQPLINEGKVDLETAEMGNIRDYDYDIRKLLSTSHCQQMTDYITREKCYCSFECAMAVNVLYSMELWPRVMHNFLAIAR